MKQIHDIRVELQLIMLDRTKSNSYGAIIKDMVEFSGSTNGRGPRRHQRPACMIQYLLHNHNANVNGLTYIDALLLLDLRIHHFSVVQHHGPASRPAVRCPSQTFGKPGIRVRQEELLRSV